MSASDKKKLRKEHSAEALTAKQRQQQAEEKKLRTYTICFVTAMILVVVAALGLLAARAITNGGLAERFTVAATIGDTELNTIEFSYYYNDAINDYYNEKYETYQDQTDSYLKAMGWDTTKPLNEQYMAEDETKTWAEYFVELALQEAKRDYALCAAAKAAGFKLTEEQKEEIDTTIANIEMWAPYYGYNDATQYMRALYGNGANMKNFREYYERCQLADAYYDAHLAEYTYTDEQMDAYQKEDDKYINYTSFTFTSAYLSKTYFQQGGTEDENGTVTYTPEEENAAREAMKLAAEELLTATTDEELAEKAAAIEVNEGTSISVSPNVNYMYTAFSGANADLTAWVTDEARQDGDIELIPIIYKTTENDQEVEYINGYYVVLFHSRNENNEPMGNVRHLLVKFEGGEEDEETGTTVYSEDEKAAAWEEAEGLLKTWKEGDATEESFIALVKEHTDDSSAETGGLYEDINPDSSYVENFLNWSIDPARQKGDVEIIETEYGCHIMYYVGDDDLTYREYLVTGEMAAADQEVWYNGLLEGVTATVGDTSKLALDMIVGASS